MTASLSFVALALLLLEGISFVRTFSAPLTFTQWFPPPSSSSSCSHSRADRRRRRRPQDRAPRQLLGIGATHELLAHNSKLEKIDDEGVGSFESTREALKQDASSPAAAAICDREKETGRHVCSDCRRSFPTRNALFRHLRGQDGGDDHDDYDRGLFQSTRRRCGQKSGMMTEASVPHASATARVPFRMAIQFGYHTQNPSPSAKTSAAESAAASIQHSLLTQPDGEEGTMDAGPNEGFEVESPERRLTRSLNVTILSVTQSSDAKLRAACLQQEADCSAANDVLVFSGEVALSLVPDGVSSSSGPFSSKAELQSFVEQFLADRIVRGRTQPDNHRVAAIRFFNRPLHAERGCTQYVYHYLMPSSWLVDPENELPGWLEKERGSFSQQSSVDRANGADFNGSARARGHRRPPALVRLKRALRSMESPRLSASEISLMEEDTCYDSHRRRTTRRRQRVAAGRFGGLAFKTRHAFHNYCDQQLMGAISPNHDVVWRCVDRARIVDFVASSDDKVGVGNDASIVLEFRGDAFLQHQIRTMVGTALSMANGWLPMDTTVPISTSPDHIVAPLPCAPSGRLYLAGTRFHFEELSNAGKPLFDASADGRVVLASQHGHTSTTNVSNVQWIQQELLSRKERLEEQSVEAEWLRRAETSVCPATRIALAAAVDDSGETRLAARNPLSQPPEEFSDVLMYLRHIVATRSWPETTAARSSVIRGESQEGLETKSMGSFTVVNPSLVNRDSYHLGNEMFPKLVDAVFALEELLSGQERDRVVTSMANGDVHLTRFPTSSHRPPSTHCAINCNAQFTPHVDSGRGLGQTMSMIVGLGEYAGGELMVEGTPMDIRYRAVEFDGWKLRHWTRQFHGERFSLVWFTPATGSAKHVASIHRPTCT